MTVISRSKTKMDEEMENLVETSLKRMRRDCTWKLKSLKNIIDDYLGKLSGEEGEPADAIAPQLGQADSFFEPFRLALASTNPKLTTTTLDCLQKLIASGDLVGADPVESQGTLGSAPTQYRDSESRLDRRDKTLMDLVVESICTAAKMRDEGVQILVVKALLSTVVAPTCEVHDATLLVVLRTIFQIHLTAKSQVARNSAETALKQMLDVVFAVNDGRPSETAATGAGEMTDLHIQIPNNAPSASTEGRASPPRSPCSPHSPRSPASPRRPRSSASPRHSLGSPRRSPGSPRHDKMKLNWRSPGDFNSGPRNLNSSEGRNSFYSAQGRRGSYAYSTGGMDQSNSIDEDEGEYISDVWNDEAIFSGPNMYPEVYKYLGYIQPPFEDIALGYRGTLYGEDGAPQKTDIPEDLIFPSLVEKDAFLVFRTLCKMSMQGLPEHDHKPTDPMLVQSKELSLKLLLYILNTTDKSGSLLAQSFLQSEKFLYAVRQYLCLSLLRNCTSPIRSVISLSLHLFLALLANYKDHLKAEVEVFITNILLKILESPNSSFDHKHLVLEALAKLCQDEHGLVEIFLNYDCDLEAIDLFQKITLVLTRVAKGPPQDFLMEDIRQKKENYMVQKNGILALVEILSSLLRANSTTSDGNITPVRVSDTAGRSVSESSQDGSLSSSSRRKKSQNQIGSSADDDGSNDFKLDMSAVVVESFDRKKRTQAEYETGCMKFNLKPMSGLLYLQSRGHLELEPKAVASFLHEHGHRLNKGVMGEFLGREKEYQDGLCVRTLHEYVDMMDFSGLKFVAAMRKFLSGFLLPGEAQKIDRMMEKFAEHYFLQNQSVFSSPDTAFILAFSTIMLNTDLHNPQIKEEKRMKKEDFIKNNKNYGEGPPLADDFLSEIFDEILVNPFVLKEDEERKKRLKLAVDSSPAMNVLTGQSGRWKRRAYNQERKDMVAAGEALIRKGTRTSQCFFLTKADISFSGYIGPMFEVVWGPMVAVFSEVLNGCDPERLDVVTECLRGLEFGVRIAGLLDIVVARDQFLNSLARFTSLDTVRAMNNKHIECIKTLLRIANKDGNILGDSWILVLRCISQLARLQLISHGLQDDVFFSEGAKVSTEKLKKKGSTRLRMSKLLNNLEDFEESFSKIFKGEKDHSKSSRELEQTNAKHVTEQIQSSVIDHIFNRSVLLNGEAIQFFVKQLCQVSREELKDLQQSKGFRTKDEALDMSQPRIFSLQKIVEVTDFNMDSRSRIVWANIWTLLSNHFADIGSMSNLSVALYAVDSLRQLSLKFLAKDELQRFSFQRLFLVPFRLIMQKNKSPAVRELVLRCIQNLIGTRLYHIKSGWSLIFEVLTVASWVPHDDITSLAFSILNKLLTEQIEIVLHDFENLVGCLYAFAEGANEQVAAVSVKHLHGCARSLIEKGGAIILSKMNSQIKESMGGTFAFKSSQPFAQRSTQETWYLHPPYPFDSKDLKLWWLVLKSLSRCVGNERLSVRSISLDTLTAIVKSLDTVPGMNTTAWESLFIHVLFPTADGWRNDKTAVSHITSKYPGEEFMPPANPLSWILSTSQPVFSHWVLVFLLDLSKTTQILPSLLAQLEFFCKQGNEVLTRFAIRALKELMSQLDNNLIVDHCDLICTLLSSLLEDFLPPHPTASLTETPVQKPSGSAISALKIGMRVATPYGKGEIVKVGKMKTCYNVRLSWGATLHSGYREQGMQNNSEFSISRSETYPSSDHRFTTKVILALPMVKVVAGFLQHRLHLLTEDGCQKLLDALTLSYHRAVAFNTDFESRLALNHSGLLCDPSTPELLPSLILQEMLSARKILSILLHLYIEAPTLSEAPPQGPFDLVTSAFKGKQMPAGERYSFAETRLIGMMVSILERFINLEKSILEGADMSALSGCMKNVCWLLAASTKEEAAFCKRSELQESNQLATLITLLLEGFKSFKKDQVLKHRNTLYPYFCEMVACRSQPIREVLQHILLDLICGYIDPPPPKL